MTKFEKDQKDEAKRLMPYFTDIAPEKRALADGLIQNAAFMRAMLNQIQETMKECGTVEDYNNGGGQAGVKISAATQSYNSLIKNYMAAIRDLNRLLPKGSVEITEKQDALAELMADE